MVLYMAITVKSIEGPNFLRFLRPATILAKPRLGSVDIAAGTPTPWTGITFKENETSS